MTRDIYFQTGNFADFEKLKIDSHFGDFRQVKIDPTCSLLLTLGRLQLYCFGQDIRPLYLAKIQEPCIGSGTGHFHLFK